mmetsp:Transcript_6894/g.14072  ORF Transcript_6894/g.14072 Transcript_6894/m.14072 type:complete len:413 (+) Transcript_6894:212-1450(+)
MCSVAIIMPSASGHGHGNLEAGPQLDEGRIQVTGDQNPSRSGQYSEERAQVGPEDVLCGRGAEAFNHVGNKRFRKLIANAIGNYSQTASRGQRSLLAQSILETIRNRGGKFLKKIDGSKSNKKPKAKGSYYQEIANQAALEKISHALRDGYVNVVEKNKRNARRYFSIPPGASPNTLVAPSPPLAAPSEHINFAFMGHTTGGTGELQTGSMNESQVGQRDAGAPWFPNMPITQNTPQRVHHQNLGILAKSDDGGCAEVDTFQQYRAIGAPLMDYQRSIMQAMMMDLPRQNSVNNDTTTKSQIPSSTSLQETATVRRNFPALSNVHVGSTPLSNDRSPSLPVPVPILHSSSKKTEAQAHYGPTPLSSKLTQPDEATESLHDDAFLDFINDALGPLESEDHQGIDDFFRQFSNE